jgi:Flp pilus assembly protein protease CpaA
MAPVDPTLTRDEERMRTTSLQLASLLLIAVALYFDLRRRSVPNWLTLAVLPLAPLLWAATARHAPATVGIPGPLFFAALSLVGALACGAVPLLLFAFKMMGGGDVKLFACVGALALPGSGLLIEWLSFMLAAVILPARLAYHGRFFSTLMQTTAFMTNPLRPADRRGTLPGDLTERVRLTPFIFVAAIAATVFQAFAQGPA